MISVNATKVEKIFMMNIGGNAKYLLVMVNQQPSLRNREGSESIMGRCNVKFKRLIDQQI